MVNRLAELTCECFNRPLWVSLPSEDDLGGCAAKVDCDLGLLLDLCAVFVVGHVRRLHPKLESVNFILIYFQRGVEPLWNHQAVGAIFIMSRG